jgi:hypothetical protein
LVPHLVVDFSVQMEAVALVADIIAVTVLRDMRNLREAGVCWFSLVADQASAGGDCVFVREKGCWTVARWIVSLAGWFKEHIFGASLA